MITLPTTKTMGITSEPRLCIFYGAPKSGKTSILSALDNTLILDTQDGSRFYENTSVQVRSMEQIREVLFALKDHFEKNGTNLYKRIAFDVATDLVEIVKPFALQLYQKTPMAIRKDGTLYSGDILALAKGAGYGYLREAFETVYESFYPYCETLILICHQKEASKYDDDASEEMILVPDLPGKMQQRNSGWADAIGHIFRKKESTFISFNSHGDVNKGSRYAPWRERVIEIMKSTEKDGKQTLDIYCSRLFKDSKDITIKY